MLRITYFVLDVFYFMLRVTYSMFEVIYFVLGITYFMPEVIYIKLGVTYITLGISYIMLEVNYIMLGVSYVSLEVGISLKWRRVSRRNKLMVCEPAVRSRRCCEEGGAGRQEMGCPEATPCLRDVPVIPKDLVEPVF